MTPQGMLPSPAAPASNSSSNLYNQISSAGMGGQTPVGGQTPADVGQEMQAMEQQPQMESLVEKATKEFGALFNSFVTLTESYPGADKEAQMVKDALANWHLKVANSLNESGGNSTY